ncbi:MAG TPA: SLC13 family permease [Planctomycetota bacterium]|nr:SLC13 family permease [Planctomycetota bacterium]
MTAAMVILLVILLVAMLFFAFEWLPPDVVALGVLLALMLTKLISPEQAFAGFGNDTVLMIFGLFVLTASLQLTGVVEMVGRAILRQSGKSPDRLLLVIMISVALLSAFVSNTAATAFFLPITFGIASKAKQSVSRFLLPLAFASILASSVTLVSTSTNLVVSNIIERYQMPPIRMFELAPVGIPIAIVGILYMYFVGRRLLPDRSDVGTHAVDVGSHPYITEIMILPGSPLAGKTLAESGFTSDLEFEVLRVVRDNDQYLWPRRDLRLQEGDVLLVEGKREEILKIKDTAGIDIKVDAKLKESENAAEDSVVVEGILLSRSPLVGRTLKSFRFKERYGLQVLALNRPGGAIRRKMSRVPLKMGDILLVEGPLANIKLLEGVDTFRVLGAVDEARPNTRKAILALAIFSGAILAATLNLLPIAIALLVGVFLVFVTRCITPQEAYHEVEWKALVLIGCMLTVGTAMQATGAEKYLAQGIVKLFGSAPSPYLLLSGFFFLTVILTQPMSNQAAAVVVAPVAIQTALELGHDPRAFAMMIAVAASCSFVTPLEPSCLLVYGPGRYRFSDFIRVGGLLTIITYGVAIVLVPLVWPP